MATIAIVRMVLFIENKLAPFLPPLKVLNRRLDSRRSGASRNANSTKGGLKMKRVFVESSVAVEAVTARNRGDIT
jgi:hypothetical protein